MQVLLSTENFAKISTFIYRKSGIYLEEEKYYKKLAKYIDKRIKSLEIDSFERYFFKLRFDDQDGEEFQLLINEITVNETYFFREKKQFEILVNKVLPELNDRIPKNKPIRILSSPCSTGEEAYSIIVHIVEDGKISNNRKIEVVGIDIDSSVIKKAKDAKYCDKSVRVVPKDILSRWFSKKSSEYSLLEDIKGSVDFHIVNVLDKIQMKKLGKFDVIFSRNMLIYFDDESRKETAMTFYDMLNKDGYIFLGDSENMSRIVPIFNSKEVDSTLIYQK
ncbi:CheR family methyltransferase [Sulfurimonas sp.]